MKAISFVLLFLLSVPCEAFIPPVGGILREIFEGRKTGNLEIFMRHRIELGTGTPVHIEERIVYDRGRWHFLWKGEGLPQSLGGSYERQGYVVSPERSFPSRSMLFLKAFTTASADDFRDQLIAERFIRRDQLLQFKPGFVPDGDPQTWETKENYLRHPDVFLHRLKLGIGIAVVGLEESTVRRAVYFDKGLRGVRRLEWKDGEELTGWSFDQFSTQKGIGTHPRRLVLDVGSHEVVQSEVLVVRRPSDRQVSEFRTAFRQADRTASMAPPAEAALKLLLGSR